VALRWKIGLALTGAAAVLLGALGLYLRAALMRGTEDVVAERLLAEARLVASAMPAPPWQRGAALQKWAAQVDDRLGARVTLLGPAGEVLADSRRDPASMGSHADRPERQEAVRRGTAWVVRSSATLGTPMLYVAASLPGTPSPGVLRLAVPLAAVESTSKHLRRGLGGAFILAALLFLGASAWLTGALTAPVQRLVDVARRVGRGDLEARVQGRAAGEVGELIEVFNSSMERLSRLVRSSQREARHYAAVLEQMGDAVVIVDAQRRVELVNGAFRRLFGARQEEVTGKRLEQIALNYDLSQLMARAVEQRAVQRGEVRALHPETRTLIGVATPVLDDQGEAVGAVGLLRDVTELHRMDQVRRDFVANASHELRTPAAGIKALAEALEAGALEDSQRRRDFVRQIVALSDRLTETLDDMLTLTRLERGQELLRPGWASAGPILAAAVQRAGARARAKGVDVQTAVADGDQLYVDAASAETILANLLDNAVKYTDAGGRVVVRGRRVAGGYEIAVEDTGVGIPADEHDRIFERFYRVDPGRGRKTGGTGLGLSIVKHSVDAHGGRVTVRSRPGEGSTFTVFLPDPASGPRRELS